MSKGIPFHLRFDPAEASSSVDHLEHDHTGDCPACHAIVARLESELENLHRSTLAIPDRVNYAIDLAAAVVMLSINPDRLVEASAEYARAFVDRLGLMASGMGLLTPDSIARGLDTVEKLLSGATKRPIGFTGKTDAQSLDDIEETIRKLSHVGNPSKKIH